MSSVDVSFSIDAFMQSAQLGSVNRTISHALLGMRTGSRRLVTPNARENQGYVFMTRPQLNLSTPNLMGLRMMYPLLNTDKNSMARWIRGTLDPRWALQGDQVFKETRESAIKEAYQNGIHSALVDAPSAFINIITNNCVTVSGFPDIQMPSYTTPEGRAGQVWQQIDGLSNLNQPIELTISLRDMAGAPLYNLLRILSIYPGFTYTGMMSPYMDFIIDDTIDYNVRVFRILMGTDGRHVASIASTYPGFISGVAAGSRYDYDIQNPYPEEQDVSYRFTFPGVEYEDPILVDDFNILVEDANPAMRGARTAMIEIPHHLLSYFTYEQTYPHINTKDMTLEWWIKRNTYDQVLVKLNHVNKSLQSGRKI